MGGRNDKTSLTLVMYASVNFFLVFVVVFLSFLQQTIVEPRPYIFGIVLRSFQRLLH